MNPHDSDAPPADRRWSIALIGLAGSEVVRDDDATRTVMLMVAMLVAGAVVLAAVTVWFWRTTRPEHPSLGPLEVMSSGRFWSRDAADQVRRLEGARPEGAEPERSAAGVLLPHGIPDPDRVIDLEMASLGTPLSFEDLAEPAPDAEPDPGRDPLLDASS
jgi:hypothetical protein